MELLNNPWITHITITVLALLLGMYVGQTSSHDMELAEELAEEVSSLEEELNSKQAMLAQLDLAIDVARAELQDYREGKTFTLIQTEVLDSYERAGIRLSADILEELLFNKQLNTVTEIKHFIETQRANWKLENTKKI